MSFKSQIAIKSLAACLAASIFCACSPAKSGDGQLAQDTPKPPTTTEASTDSGSDVAEDTNQESSASLAFAKATTFEAIGLTPGFYCQRRNPSNCYVKLRPPTNDDVELKIAGPSNPHRMVLNNSAFEDVPAYNGTIYFPADLDYRFIAYYVPSFTLSDDIDYEDMLAKLWIETALLPVTWSETGCSGVMGITRRRGLTEHPTDAFFFEDRNGGINIQMLSASQKILVELTASGYQIRTSDGETASLILTPDDEGRCVAKAQTDK